MAEWSEEKIFHLIKLYEENSCLWDQQSREYLKKNLKEDAWRAIAAEIGRPMEDCKTKMTNLTASFRRERRKVVTTTTGQGANEVYVSKWFAFEAFQFLIDKNQPRKRLNSEDLLIKETTHEDSNSENVDNPDIVQVDTSLGEECFITPTVGVKKNASKKMKVDQHSAMMTGAFDILKTAAEKLKTPAPPLAHDETTAFFNYVSAKVKTYSLATKKAVQHSIFDILMKADSGVYELHDFHSQYILQPNYPDNRYSQSFMLPSGSSPYIQTSPRLSPSPSSSPAPSVSPTPSVSPAPSLSPAPSPYPYGISSTASTPSPGNAALNMTQSSQQGNTVPFTQVSNFASLQKLTNL